jgi:hypothetical protein
MQLINPPLFVLFDYLEVLIQLCVQDACVHVYAYDAHDRGRCEAKGDVNRLVSSLY